MAKQKNINTSRCDILRLTQNGYGPTAIADELGCSPEAVRAFLRTERKYNPVGRETMTKRLQGYLAEHSPRKVYYQELLNELDTYPQLLNYSIRKLLEKGIIGCTFQPKYKTRLYWITNS